MRKNLVGIHSGQKQKELQMLAIRIFLDILVLKTLRGRKRGRDRGRKARIKSATLTFEGGAGANSPEFMFRRIAKILKKRNEILDYIKRH